MLLKTYISWLFTDSSTFFTLLLILIKYLRFFFFQIKPLYFEKKEEQLKLPYLLQKKIKVKFDDYYVSKKTFFLFNIK